MYLKMDKRDIIMEVESNVDTSVGWEKPKVEDLGDAKDVIQAVNTLGPGDAQFSLLASA